METRATMKAAILLLPLMGMTWLFGFVSLDYGVDALKTLTLAFNIIFIVLNSLQVSIYEYACLCYMYNTMQCACLCVYILYV